MLNFRQSAAFVLTTVIAAATLLSASAASTDKTLSSNFTLVSLVEGENLGVIEYVQPDGSPWRDPESFILDTLGAQLIRRQYDDAALSAESGSVLVRTEGPIGSVVQVQARGTQVPTFGAYVGVNAGASEANLPLVMRRLTTASGVGNSQIIIQNAGSSPTDVEVMLIPGASGLISYTKTFNDLAPNAAVAYDLDDESSLPDHAEGGWFGAATIRATSAGGRVAVVAHLFTGEHAMQTFNAFTTSATRWGVPLFTSRLANSLSTPVAVQNVSGMEIPAQAVTLHCVKDPAAVEPDGMPPLPPTLDFQNTTAIADQAAIYFNPVTDTTMPAGWFGACTVASGDFPTVVFVQMRVVNGDRAAAYEGIPLDSTATTVVVPLYAKRLGNGFASAVTIQNLSESNDAHVTLEYRGATGSPASCTQTYNNVTIPAGGSLIQNHRVEDDVPEIEAGCVGTLTVTSSDQPIHAMVQLDLLDDITGRPPEQVGDPFQAHNAFPLAPAASN